MDELKSLLTIALGVLTIATAAGLGLQRAAVTSLRERLKDSDEELERKGRRLDDADAKILILENDIAALGRVVTGEAHWVSIGDKLDTHHNEAVTHWKNDEQILQEIRDRLPPRPHRPHQTGGSTT